MVDIDGDNGQKGERDLLDSRLQGGNRMPRQKSLLTVIRELVQSEVRDMMASLLGSPTKAANGRRRRRGPGRPKGSKNRPKTAVVVKRGPGRPKGSKNKKRGPGRPRKTA